MVLSKKQLDYIVQHAKDNYPQEVCGIIAGINNKAKKIYKMKNVSDKPEICYFMKPEEQLKIFKEMRAKKLELLGIYHSHTRSEAYPSSRDIEMAYYPEADYVIISLQNFSKPDIRTYKIIDGKIKAEKIREVKK
ncbi:MAG: M67 family metallopeptidase [Elusimicrobia bacterium]|nr:M67 family metallopeptidase [Elusimicrobiota bacterium]